jgi:hypothetical protein
MSERHGREPGGWADRSLKPCVNPLCERFIPVGILYCCHACDLAHEGRYEIHADGPLGHSPTCNDRWAARVKRAPARPHE